MLSERKVFLRLVELLAIASAGAGTITSLLLGARLLGPARLEPYVMLTFIAAFFIFMVAVLLVTEFVKATRQEEGYLERSREVSMSEIRTLVSWCPRWLLVSSIVVLALSFVGCLASGSVSWREGTPLAQREALGLASGLTLFLSLSVPVLASATRMPGAYEDFSSTEQNGI